MKLLRFVLSVVTLLLLGGGYFASEMMALQGRASEYTARIDQPAIVQLSQLLLLASVLLAFVPDRSEDAQP